MPVLITVCGRAVTTTTVKTTDDIRNVTEARLPQSKQTLRSTDGIQMEKNVWKIPQFHKIQNGSIFHTFFNV